MPLPEISFAESTCEVPLGKDPGTLDPGPTVTLHLKDIAHSRWEALQANAGTELEALGAVLHAMLAAVEGEDVPWTRAECVEVTTTWSYR